MGNIREKIIKYCRSLRGRLVYVSLSRRSERLENPEETEIMFPGIKSPIILRLKTSDVATFKDIFVKGQYDFKPAESPRVIIDAGANIGLTSLVFANSFPEAKIIAVEPEQSNYEILLKNTATYDNIIVIQAAIWNNNDTVEIVDPGLGNWGFQVGGADDQQAQAKSVMSCRGMTIDKIMAEHGIDFIDILKMDIEGGEKEVFEDADRWIDKIGILTVELHDRLKEGCSRSLANATCKFKYRWKHGENVYFSTRQVR
ncbi:MAG: FkbM family methyltransferase [Thermodesulfobacteriota bacterium]